MFLRKYLFALIILNIFLPYLIANPLLDQRTEEIIEVTKNDSSVTTGTNCNACFSFKKLGRAFLRGSIFFAETIITYKVINYLYSKYYEHDFFVNFNEFLLCCLIWELAGQSEGLPSFFREKENDTCKK